MKKLASELIGQMGRLTALKSVEVALENTRVNLQYPGRTISDLMAGNGRSGSAIVIGAGPSLHRRDPVGQIKRLGYAGEVVCADGALPYCLRNGLVPDYVVTLDPHPTRIIRWFGDPDLDGTRLARDDYFRRQDLDPHLGEQESAKNRELIELVNKHGPKIKAIVAACVSPNVTRRCIEAGMELYWWNPLYDDIKDASSVSRQAYNLNKVPCMATGGNCGSAAWVFANMVLRKSEIALVGIDFGYAPGTPLEKTQYYKEVTELFGEKASEAYVDVYNPFLEETWFTDPTYYWYRETFLQMARNAECLTFNCTEGGILFGEGVEFTPLEQFLDRWNRRIHRFHR